jgi:hypothetical protein
MKFEADLCRWVESFMSERKVRIKMDGRTGKIRNFETEVLQGSPTSPLLLVINNVASSRRRKRKHQNSQRCPLWMMSPGLRKQEISTSAQARCKGAREEQRNGRR